MSGMLGSIYNNVSFALYLHGKAIANLQEQASTGARINRVSDGPSEAYQILELDSQQRSLENYIDNLSQMVSTLEVSSTIVENMISAIAETKTRLTQISSGTYTEEDRQRVAEGIDDILEQIVTLANTKHTNQYLFAGSNTATLAPYAVERAGGRIARVIYQGSYEIRSLEIAPALKSSAIYAGDEIFRSNNRSAPVFLGNTGAQPGTGTSSVVGDVWLTVIHDGSNYKLSIDDGATYVTVPVGGDPNQPVTDSRTGKVLYVDSTGINSTGTEMVSVPGTYDVFSVLIGVRDVLQNEKGLPISQLQELVNHSLNALDEIRNLLVQTSVAVGSKINFLDNLKDGLKNRKYDTEDEVTRLQEADVAQIAIDLSRREVLYQMSLSVAGKLMSISLLDFIR